MRARQEDGGRRRAAAIAGACLLAALGARGGVGEDGARRAEELMPRPYFDARGVRPEYGGPGREAREPEVTEVRLAYFGPAESDHPEWGEGWRGASLAVAEANGKGGYGGKPFRLMAAWSENPWGTGVSGLTRLVYEQGAWAVVGGVDGAGTHLAEQVVVKARVPQVAFGNTDASVHLTNVPWTLGLLPTDDTVAPLMAREVGRLRGAGSWAALSSTGHDSRATWRALEKALAACGEIAPALHLEISEPDAESAAARRVAGSGAKVVVVVAEARRGGRLVRALRESGFAGAIVGGVACGRAPFMAEAGATGDGVVVPVLFEPGEASRDFVDSYRARYRSDPDWLAAHAFDATQLVIEAIKAAGLNRVRILDALRHQVVPRNGATGRIDWDPTGRVRRSVSLGVIDHGHVVTRRP